MPGPRVTISCELGDLSFRCTSEDEYDLEHHAPFELGREGTNAWEFVPGEIERNRGLWAGYRGALVVTLLTRVGNDPKNPRASADMMITAERGTCTLTVVGWRTPAG
jgi:hypothetical protein